MKKDYKDCFYGIYGIRLFSKNMYSDPYIVWHGYYFNYWDIENALYDEFKEKYHINETTPQLEVDTLFYNYLHNNPQYVKTYLLDCIYGGYKYKSYNALVASY